MLSDVDEPMSGNFTRFGRAPEHPVDRCGDRTTTLKYLNSAPRAPFLKARACWEKELLMQAGYDVPEQDWFDRDPDVLKLKRTMKSNHSANFAAGEHHLLQQETERFSRETGWGVALICLPKRSFVIGSHGLTIIRRGGSIGRVGFLLLTMWQSRSQRFLIGDVGFVLTTRMNRSLNQ